MNTKLIKDPVHGYIKIQKDYMKNIVDSCEFQRLRNIRQTSYDSLYPGSSHNRFTHSLGVYYLGEKAFESLRKNFEIKKERGSIAGNIDWEGFRNTFEIACLLHDVGHTPFSHTGENFLLMEKEADEFELMKKLWGKGSAEVCILYNELLRTMRERLQKKTFEDFLRDFAETVEGSSCYVSGKKVAKPHEIMSVIIGISTYEMYLNSQNVDFDLFGRMILGIRYKESSTVEAGIKNALIQMLNSSIIDVDRLDYIMRDMQMSGFDSMTIDIERLLESVTLIYDSQKQQYRFGYEKNALSTIENVIVAHDAERRWIQGHPVVMYDSFLVKKCIKAVEQQFKEVKEDGSKRCIFQRKALTEEGVRINNNLILRLMNDGDFLFLMKQINKDNPQMYYIKEYLARDQRRSPIWKSESEFKLILSELTAKQQEILMDTFTDSSGQDEESSIGSNLNDKRILELQKNRELIEKDENLREEDKKNKVFLIQRQLFWLNQLKTYCHENGMDFNIHNQKTEVFQSKVNELQEGGVEIWYEQFRRPEKIADVLNLYNTNNKTSIRLFYLYIKKTENFTMKGFVKFLKNTLDEYERQFID